MEKLIVEKLDSCGRMDTMKIAGLTDGELSELKSMEHYESGEKLLEMLDFRNNGLGTAWHNGPGVWSHWFDNEFAYVNIGRSCD